MTRKNMITVAAEDVHTVVVGSLKKFQHKRKMANDPSFQAAIVQEARRPTTLRALLGVKDGYRDSQGTGHLVLGSMSEMFGVERTPMKTALGLA
jgi:hypothetical protein